MHFLGIYYLIGVYYLKSEFLEVILGSKRITKKGCQADWCPIEIALEVIGGMWKVIIIRELLSETKRYSQLHRALNSITHKMLAQQLRELEKDGIVNRKVYPVVPPKVEYSLTPLGHNLEPILVAMQNWGNEVSEYRKEQAIEFEQSPAD